MTKKKSAAVVLAAGLGTRMKSDLPKVMHAIAGRPMIQHILATLKAAGIDQIMVIVGDGDEAVTAAVQPHPTMVQKERLGTAHAVLQAADFLAQVDGDVLVLAGADPLIRPETLLAMLEARQGSADPAVVVMGFRPDDPGLYGRLMTDDQGHLEAIVEARDASPEQLAVSLCNAGTMAIDGALLPGLIEEIGNDNAKGEYYLTDIVALARGRSRACMAIEGDGDELLGVDSRADLAAAEAIAQDRLRRAAMDNGATLIDPGSVHFSFDTVLGRDVVIEPNVFFGPGVTVGDGSLIKACSHIEGATIGKDCTVGPFARLRPGADIAAAAKIGNFVEIKEAKVETGAKVSHLTYIGDARIGAEANIGAGTITCNYDGFLKGHTDIGAGAFIGSNTALVAPVAIGDGAIIGAGSVITKNVATDALAVTRAAPVERPGWAKDFRQRRAAEKAELANKKG